MRIIGGKFKNRNFYMPEGIRPSQNILIKSFFDILGQDMTGVDFIDICAGSGAVGLEAVSRGATKCVFLEKNPKCVKILEENIQLLGINDKGKLDSEIEVIQQDCFAGIKSLATRKSRFSIAFVDPPYDRGMAKKALKTLDPYDILQPNCILAIQHDKKETLPERQGRFLLFRQKILGSTVLSFYHDESHSE